MEFIRNLLEYFRHALDGFKPAFAFVVSAVMYLLFPEPAYLNGFYVVTITMVIDVFTKWYSIKKMHNCTFKAARKNKFINSNAMFEGTKIKIITYLIIFLLAGLSYRVSPIAGASVFLSSFVYSMLFLRECQSILENLDDAGADVGVFLFFVKKKQNEILGESVISNETINNDPNDLGC